MSGIYAKLLKAMQAMDNPVKDKSAYKYNYADLSQVLSIVKPALYENGLGLTQSTVYEEEAPYLVTIVFDDAEMLALSKRRLYDFTDAQAVGSGDTYTRRYELMKVFCLAAEDDDGAATKGKTAQVPTGLQEAQQRLVAAENAYCELMGIPDARGWHKDMVMTRKDYANTAESLNKIAAELEGAMQ